MDGKAVLLAMNLGVQEKRMSSVCLQRVQAREERASSRNPATAPRGYVQGDRTQCGVELQGAEVSCKRDSSENGVS